MGKLYDLLNSIVSKVNSAVKVVEQTFTDAEKAQARANIGAAAEGESGGVSSWNDLTDKPVVTEGGDTLTVGDFDSWAAQFSEDNPPTMSQTGGYGKVSDAVPTLEDCQDGITMVFESGRTFTATYEKLAEIYAEYGALFADFFIVIPSDNYEGDTGVFPEKGIYFLLDPSQWLVSITIPGYTGFATEKIAPSHLYQPDWNQNDETQPDFVKNRTHWEETVETGGDTLMWDGNTEGLTIVDDAFVLLSNATPTVDEIGENSTVDMGEGVDTLTIVSAADAGLGDLDGVYALCGAEIGMVAILTEIENAEVFESVLPQTGIWISSALTEEISSLTITIPGYTGFVTTETVVHPLDTKFLPEHLQFGETETGGDTLTWDGNTEGLEAFMDAYYKVSDAKIYAETLTNGFTGTAYDSDLGHNAVNPNLEEVGDGVYFQMGVVLFVLKNATFRGVDLTPGIYLCRMTEEGWEAYVTSITIPGYTGFPLTKKMDEKYLPTIPAEKLPGAVVLYTDAENYLYATEDTSDTSKRMTRTELLKTVLSGRTLYTYMNPAYIPVIVVDDGESMAAFTPAMSLLDISEAFVGYTAEYTAT